MNTPPSSHESRAPLGSHVSPPALPLDERSSASVTSSPPFLAWLVTDEAPSGDTPGRHFVPSPSQPRRRSLVGSGEAGALPGLPGDIFDHIVTALTPRGLAAMRDTSREARHRVDARFDAMMTEFGLCPEDLGVASEDRGSHLRRLARAAVNLEQGTFRLHRLPLACGVSHRVSFALQGRALITLSSSGACCWDCPVSAEPTRVGGIGFFFGLTTTSTVWEDATNLRIVTGCADGTLRVYNVEDNPIPAVWRAHDGWVLAVAVHAARELMVSGGDDTAARLWDLKSEPPSALGEPLWHAGGVGAVAISRSGTLMATGSHDTQVRVWRLGARGDVTPLHTLTGHSEVVHGVAFAPDERQLASCSDDTTVRLWDLENANVEPVVLLAHSAWVWTVVYSPDGKRLLSGGADRRALLWDLRGANDSFQALKLRGHQAAVSAAAFAPCGTRLATVGHDNMGHVWDFADM